MSLPFEPFDRWLRLRHGIPDGASSWNAGVVASACGTTTTTVYRWRREGLSPWLADTLAVRAGTDARLIWGADWDEACVNAEAARGCQKGHDPSDVYVSPQGYSRCRTCKETSARRAKRAA